MFRWLTTMQVGGDVVYGDGGPVTSGENAEGQMPPLEKVLAAVEETCKTYRHRILDARKPVH